MKRVLAIARLTVKAAFRYRLIQVLGFLLLLAVVGLPLIIKHDDTAQGFTQLLLTYTLGSITTLLAFSTLWLGCGSLARDIEECQMQMIVVKPIGRWEIWLGKWLGLLATNGLLLGLSGTAVFGLLQYRASQLPAAEQTKLHNEVLVSRGSVKETLPDFTPLVEKQLAARLHDSAVATMDREFVRQQIVEQIRSGHQYVGPGAVRPWRIDLGAAAARLKDKPIYVRVKFNSARSSPTGTFATLWQIGAPETQRVVQFRRDFPPDSVNEFELPPNLFDSKGILTILIKNPNDVALLFQLEDGLEILYP
ncbi:MAG: ABC transporter permease [Acidobacteriota bacterium]